MAEERPFDALDFGLLLLVAPLHPLCFVLVVGQWFVRRSPAILSSAADLLGQVGVERPLLSGRGAGVVRALLPGAAGLLPALAPASRQEQSTPRQQAAQDRNRPRWLQVVNDEPDQRPHMLILGPTRSGKTTLATAAMGDREGRAVVITPKLNPSNWRGAEIVTLDDDATYAPITAALDAIEQEKRDRLKVLRTRGAAALEPLTIVFDEIGELAAFEPRAAEMMTQLSSMGAELKIRLIGIGTSDEALGIKRWKATRNNYVRIETDADRRATLDDGVRKLPVTTQDVVPRAQVAQLAPWRGGPLPATGTTQNLRAPAEATPAQVIVAAPTPAPALARTAVPDPLLASLIAELPPAVKAAVPDISPDRAARLAAILDAQGLTEQQVIRIAGGAGDTIVIQANKNEAPAAAPAAAATPSPITKPQPRERREGALSVRNRRLKLERKAYYEQAARDGRSLQSAYDERPAGHKGDYNEAARWYRDEKRRIKAS